MMVRGANDNLDICLGAEGVGGRPQQVPPLPPPPLFFAAFTRNPEPFFFLDLTRHSLPKSCPPNT